MQQAAAAGLAAVLVVGGAAPAMADSQGSALLDELLAKPSVKVWCCYCLFGVSNHLLMLLHDLVCG